MKYYFLSLIVITHILASSFSFAMTAESVAAIPRLIELSEIPTQAAVDEVILLAEEGSDNEMRQQFVFTALSRIGPSKAGDAYAKKVLDSSNASVTSLRGALGYLAEHVSSWMVPYAERYLAATNEGPVRCMAALVAGRLGLINQKATVIEILNNDTYQDWRSHAALGLAHLVTQAEFTALIEPTTLRDWDKKQITIYSDFITSTDADKVEKIIVLLKKGKSYLVLAVLRYLLENNKPSLLLQHGIITSDATTVTIETDNYRALVRVLGYQITGNKDAVVIAKSPLW